MALRSKSDPRVDYMGPEHGPFLCGHCTHFRAPAACEQVQGVINPHGCCNLYTPLRHAMTMGVVVGMPGGSAV